MLASNNPEIIIESPVRDPAARRCVRLCPKLRPLVRSSCEVCERIVRHRRPLPPHPGPPPGCPDMLHREKPVNQAAFHEWVLAVHRRVFQLETRPEGPMIPVDAPAVKGLAIYSARCGETRFYGAWVDWSGTFLGWMRIQPNVSGIESDYAVGDVLGRPMFMGIVLDLSDHMAVDRFRQVLKEAAWDLGAADG